MAYAHLKKIRFSQQRAKDLSIKRVRVQFSRSVIEKLLLGRGYALNPPFLVKQMTMRTATTATLAKARAREVRKQPSYHRSQPRLVFSSAMVGSSGESMSHRVWTVAMRKRMLMSSSEQMSMSTRVIVVASGRF